MISHELRGIQMRNYLKIFFITNSTLILAKSGDAFAWLNTLVGAKVVALVVALVVLPSLQMPKKAQGS